MRINAYTARYTYKPEDNPLIDFSANAWATKAQSEAYNGLSTVTPLFGDAGAPNQLTEDGYQDALRNRSKDKRWGLDLSNTSRFDTGIAIALAGFRATRRRQMARQYGFLVAPIASE